MSLFAISSELLSNVQTHFQTLLSVGSALVTAYFWLVRVNREREAVRVYQAGAFDGMLDRGTYGVWIGKLILANRSIMPTGIVEAKVELFWNGSWLPGKLTIGQGGSELPWNLAPQQVVPQKVAPAFVVGEQTTREQVRADQRLRFTFLTVEGKRVVQVIQTNKAPALV